MSLNFLIWCNFKFLITCLETQLGPQTVEAVSALSENVYQATTHATSVTQVQECKNWWEQIIIKFIRHPNWKVLQHFWICNSSSVVLQLKIGWQHPRSYNFNVAIEIRIYCYYPAAVTTSGQVLFLGATCWFVYGSVCLSVCLSVCHVKWSSSLQIKTKIVPRWSLY